MSPTQFNLRALLASEQVISSPSPLVSTAATIPAVIQVKRVRNEIPRRADHRTMNLGMLNSMTEKQIHTLLCKARWPKTDGAAICPHCGCLKSYRLSTNRRFKCAECRRQFSVTSGTTRHGIKISNRRLLEILFLFVSASQGIPSSRISDIVGIDRKAALLITKKIREALFHSMLRTTLCGEVEIDGIYFTKKPRLPNMGRASPRIYPKKSDGKCVLSMVQRNGPTVALVVSGENRESILAAVRAHIEDGTHLFTDGLNSYGFLRAYFRVDKVNHSIEFANDCASTNYVESFHARLRAALGGKGVYKRVATGPNLDLYVAEMAYRHSTSRQDLKSALEDLLSVTLSAPPSFRFAGYWQFRR